MIRPASFIIIVLVYMALFLPMESALAGQQCWVEYKDPPGKFVQVCSGGGGEPEPPDGGGSCEPGTIILRSFYGQVPGGDPELCFRIYEMIDACTGMVVATHVDYVDSIRCEPGEEVNPCDEFIVSPGGIVCDAGFGFDWRIEAAVGFPVTLLDLRPFPATLVRWPTAARCSDLSTGADTGTLDYVGNGGGGVADPHAGDWRNLALTISLQPAGVMELTLPNIGTLALTPGSDTSQPYIFQWEVPSHPAAGGSTLAGDVTGLDELPADIPVFVGLARSPYRLFWTFTYEEYTVRQVDVCVSGPDEHGNYGCQTSGDIGYDDGHWETEREYKWKNHSLNGEILPSMVVGLPEAIAADLNNDGTPDAYWNYNVTIRRMDGNNRPYGHPWERSWNWGGLIYWAVREGQGQIGWPGVP